MKIKTKEIALVLSFVALGCGLLPGPTPPTPPAHSEECQALIDTGIPECSSTDPPMTCGECWHNPTQDPKHCEKAPDCQTTPPPLPQPQCPTFTDRGGTLRCQSDACDCYCGQEFVECEVVPPPEECGFPQGIPNNKFTGVSNPGVYGSVVNRVMADLTGCAVGSDCPITFHPDAWMGLVCEGLCEKGLNCGRHVDTPPGATDQISVKQGDFCNGIHENYKIYNYGGGKVIWAPNANQDGWLVDCGTPPPPVGDCPQPHPDLDKMKFNAAEKGSHLDTTWTTNGQPGYCADIGYCCMPGTGTPPNTCGSPGCIPRGGCPVRGDGDPTRATCEAELCAQKWKCDGQPYPPYRGNPAQTDCRGHYRTWCSTPGSTAALEGDR